MQCRQLELVILRIQRKKAAISVVSFHLCSIFRISHAGNPAQNQKFIRIVLAGKIILHKLSAITRISTVYSFINPHCPENIADISSRNVFRSVNIFQVHKVVVQIIRLVIRSLFCDIVNPGIKLFKICVTVLFCHCNLLSGLQYQISLSRLGQNEN